MKKTNNFLCITSPKNISLLLKSTKISSFHFYIHFFILFWLVFKIRNEKVIAERNDDRISAVGRGEHNLDKKSDARRLQALVGEKNTTWIKKVTHSAYKRWWERRTQPG